MDIEEFQQLKTKIDKMTSDADRAEGELTQLMKQLKSEFGCGSEGDGRGKLKELDREHAKIEKDYLAKLKSFREAYGDDRLSDESE